MLDFMCFFLLGADFYGSLISKVAASSQIRVALKSLLSVSVETQMFSY